MKAILKWKGLKQNREQHEDPRSKLDTHSPPTCSSASSLSSRKSHSREVSPIQDDKPRVSVQDLGSASDDVRETIPSTEINETQEIDEEMGSNSSSGELETHLGDEEHDQPLEEDQLVDVEGEIGSQPTDLSQNHQTRDQSDEEIEDSRSQSCDWCRNKLNSNQFTMRSEVDQKVRSFCTERCFSQYRRAAFKKSKICDWCRKSPLAAESGGMRTISMVEKNSQLNFCDEQCLGQYKMNMFCQEARAQLALLPDALKKIMSGQSNAVATKSAELWLAHQHAQITEQLRKDDKNKNEALALNLNVKSEAATKPSNSSERSRTQKRSASPSLELSTDRIHPRKKPMVKVKPEHFLKQKRSSIDGRPIPSSNGLRDHRQSRRRMHSPVLASRAKSPIGVAPRIRKPANNHTASLKAQSHQTSPTVGSVPPPPPLMAHAPRPGLDLRSNMFPMGALGSVLPPPPLASGPQLQSGPRPPLAPQMSSLLPPPTLMLPLPCIVPFPIPIPIPIPIPFPSQAGFWGSSSISPDGSTRVAKTPRTGQQEVKVKCEVKEEEPDPRPTSAPINRSPSETSEPMDTTTELRRARRRALLMDIPSTNKSVQKH